MISFKSLLESHDRREGKDRYTSYEQKREKKSNEGQSIFLFNKLVKDKQQGAHMHGTMADSSQNNIGDQQRVEIGKIPYVSDSLTCSEYSSQNEQYSHKNFYAQQNRLYPDLTEDQNNFLKPYESELEIYKLEKANQIADIYLKTKKPVQQIMKNVLASVFVQLSQILRGTQNNKAIFSTGMKKKQFLSTLGSPNSNQHHWSNVLKSNEAMGSNKNNSLKPSPPPKIIEFTLGNHRNEGSNVSQEKLNWKDQFEDVSEFFYGKPNGPKSRQIKQRVMGNHLQSSKQHKDK